MYRALPLCLILFAVPATAQERERTLVRASDAAALKAALEAAPDNVGLRIRWVQALLGEGQKDTSRARQKAVLETVTGEWRRLAELNPELALPHRALAGDAMARRRFEEALGHLDEVIRRSPRDVEVRRWKVTALFRLRRHADAAACLVEWISGGPLPKFGTMSGFISGLVIDAAMREALHAALERAVAAEPRHVQLRLYLASLKLENAEAEAAWKLMHEAERLGLCSDFNGDRHAFVQILDKRSAEHGDPAAFGGRNLAELRRLAREFPDHLGLTFRLARQLEAAALKDRADGGDAAAAAGLKEAEDLYTALVPKLGDPSIVELRLGFMAMDRKAWPEAAAHFRAAFRSRPHYVAAQAFETEARARMNDVDGALAALVPFIERIDLLDSVVRLMKGWIADPAARGKLLSALESAVAARPKNPWLRLHLAAALHLAGEKEKACRAALEAEWAGLAGSDGAPHPLIVAVLDGKPLEPKPTPDEGLTDGDGTSK